MAGDWIKMRTDLASDPAVIFIAARLKKNEDTIVGKLHRLWSWADKHAVVGKITGVKTEHLDKQVSCRGFCAAMIDAGWLIETADGIEFPNFDRHNGKTAKMRADMQLRKQKERDKNATPVTEMSQNFVTETRHVLIREEKRRIKNNTAPPLPAIEQRKQQFEADLAAMAAKGIQ